MTAPTRRRPRVTDCRARIDADRVPVLDDCEICEVTAALYDATGVMYRCARTPKDGAE